MPRRKRSTLPWLDKCCFHVSNTAYGAAPIFRFANMRTLAADRLRALKDRHDISVLNYLLHPDLRNTRCWTVTTARKRAQEFIRSLAPKK